MPSDLAITAVDTNILADIFFPDPIFGQASKAAIERCALDGKLVACEIVWSEIAAAFDSSSLFASAMENVGVEFSATDVAVALFAGQAWRAYRRAGGSRKRIIADFLIGADAVKHANRLLTRDRGFYSTYFPALLVVDPSTYGATEL